MSESESEIGFAQLGLGSVLKQNRLTVPANQREYSWEEKEVTTLFKDFSREVAESHRVYFLGTIVTIPRASGILEVVDGQQRLATTAILLCAIKNFLTATEKDLADSVEADFLSVFNRNTRSRVPRLQLNLDDNDFFRSLLSGSSPALQPTKPSHRLIQEAFDEAGKHVKSIVSEFDVKDHGSVLNRWIDFIEAKASVILLRVPNATNAYRMFETLNDRGKRVSQSDLVKNYLFGQSGDRLSEVQQRWAYMRGALETTEDEDATIEFLRHALTVVRGFVRGPDVYDAVQRHAKGEQPVVSFVGQLEVLANTFVALQSPDHERWNRFSDTTRRALEVLNLFDLKIMRPLTLAIASRFADREIETALRFCVSLSVRLMIANRTRTGSVEEGLADAGYKIFVSTSADMTMLKALLEKVILSDGQFRVAFRSATVSNRKLARYYMRSLEMEAKGEREAWHIPNDDKSIINLEHVLPERPERNWPQFTDDEVKLYRGRIGNFVLLRASENSHLRSSSFADKGPVYRDCPYALTRQVGEAEEWTPRAIEDRQLVLADMALKAWRT